MKITEVNITPVKPSNGFVAYASCIYDERFYLGSIGVHKRLDGKGYRITYPERRIGNKRFNYFHPISKAIGEEIESVIQTKCIEICEKSDEQYGRHNKTTYTDK